MSRNSVSNDRKCEEEKKNVEITQEQRRAKKNKITRKKKKRVENKTRRSLWSFGVSVYFLGFWSFFFLSWVEYERTMCRSVRWCVVEYWKQQQHFVVLTTCVGVVVIVAAVVYVDMYGRMLNVWRRGGTTSNKHKNNNIYIHTYAWIVGCMYGSTWISTYI